MRVALLDYGAGNLTSVRKAFAALDAELMTPTRASELGETHGIIVPGVGHFDATSALGAEWCDALRARVEAGVPLLGICLGLQWLFEGSSEARDVPGLGLVSGMCARIDAPKVPHVGWNSLSFPRPSRLMANVPDGAQVYFTHSYAAPLVDATVATTTYGTTFSAAIERDNVSAVQFHPEKSGDIGLRILRNWLEAWDVRRGA
jgi:glutamine amidotransferase